MARTKNPTSPAVAAAAAKDATGSEAATSQHAARSKASSKRGASAASPPPKAAQEPEEDTQHLGGDGATPEPGSGAKRAPATKKAKGTKSKTAAPAEEGDGAGVSAAEATPKRSRLGKGKKQEEAAAEEPAAEEGNGEGAGDEGSKEGTPAKKARGGVKKAAAGARGKKGAKAAAQQETAVGAGEGQDTEQEVAGAAGDAEAAAATTKGKRKKTGGSEGEEGEAPKKKRSKKAPPVERVVYSEELRRPLPPDHSGPVTKIMSWNVAGLRGVLKKNPAALSSLIERESPDVLCLQEIKLPQDKVGEITTQLNLPQGWHVYFNCCITNGGYSGVAILSRHKPQSVTHGMGLDEHDAEGRVLVAEFPALHVVSVYTPNSGEGLKRLDYRVGAGGWDESFAGMIKRLQETKPVVVIGDINVCPKEIDIHNPKTNLKSAGFTQEERDSFAQHLVGDPASGGCGLVDTLRAQHPEVQAYTYYSHRFNCRAKGIGWRLDNTLVSPSLAPAAHDSFILKDVVGSDHVPLGVTLLVDMLKPPA